MSFGDPNNPYGQQQQGGQPDYGYPQQGGQPQGQPGYGYPQAPPVQPYGDGGYGGGPTTMPGSVKAAQVMTWVIVGLQVIGAVLMFLGGMALDELEASEESAFDGLGDSAGILYAYGVFAILWGAFAVFLAVNFSKGRNGIRIAALVFGIITAILGLYPFLIVGLAHLVLGILIAVFVGKSDGSAWFNRPRA
ncbi:hypothetical protein ACWF94_10730 [Streptomyces sp. NPDC055078]